MDYVDNVIKRILYGIFIIGLLFIITGCNSKENNTSNNVNDYSEVVDSVKIIIDDKEYLINLEDNETVRSLLTLLPLEIDMNELNGNEKYVYLDTSLPTNEFKPKHINQGDVMLYGNNCLVIFYKSFDTSYSYTLIGHIDSLDLLDDKNITVRIEK